MLKSIMNCCFFIYIVSTFVKCWIFKPIKVRYTHGMENEYDVRRIIPVGLAFLVAKVFDTSIKRDLTVILRCMTMTKVVGNGMTVWCRSTYHPFSTLISNLHKFSSIISICMSLLRKCFCFSSPRNVKWFDVAVFVADLGILIGRGRSVWCYRVYSLR